jgi:hypothetical protein
MARKPCFSKCHDDTYQKIFIDLLKILIFVIVICL